MTSTTSTIVDQHMATIMIFVIIGTVVFFFLAALPRAVARFSTIGAGEQGWTLRYAPPTIRNPLDRQPSARRFANEKPLFTRRSSTLDRVVQYNSQPPRLPPAHFPSWRTILSPLSARFSFRVFGYTAGQATILLGYAVLISIGVLLYSNPVKNAKRAGWIALSQYPVAFLLSTKNSLIGLLVGKGYEKLNYVHRWVGQLMFIATLFHVVSYLIAWTKAGTINAYITRSIGVAGTTALGAMSLLAICSLPIIRKRYYTLFTYTHWIGFTTMLIATCFHIPSAVPYVLASVGIYTLDLILRMIQSHYTTATVHFIPELNATRLSIPTLRSGWRAGQHVRLCVISGAMGTSVLESHPFTIASASDDEEGVVLYCKVAGDWTGRLAQLARDGGLGSRVLEKGKRQLGLDAGYEYGFGSGSTVDVIVQGPYGGPGHAVFSSYSAAVFVCGGSGITFGLAGTQEIMRDAFDRSSRVRLVDLIWVIPDPSAVLPLLPALVKLKEQALVITSVSLRIAVHYTRATGSFPAALDNIPEGITLTAGRPDVSDSLYAAIGCSSVLKTTTQEGVHGVVVGVCGPKALVEGIRDIERGIGAKVRSAVGGVELVEEVFGL